MRRLFPRSGVMLGFVRRARIWFIRDKSADHIKRQIAHAQRSHKPVRHLQTALRDLRIDQLRASQPH